MTGARTLVRVSLILLIVQSASSEWEPNNAKTETLCSKPECKARGKFYKSNMDANTHPCQDFYTFACGNFPNSQRHPKYAPEWNVLHVMNYEFTRIIRDTLKSCSFSPSDHSLVRLAKEVYENCVKIPEYSMKEASYIASDLKKIVHVSRTPLWDMHSKYLRLSGESAFFRTRTVGNKQTDGIPMLMLMEPVSAYGSIYHDTQWKPQEKKAYTDFLFHIMRSLKMPGPNTITHEKIEKVFAFRKKFNQIIKQNSDWAADNFNSFTERDLFMWFDNRISRMTDTQNIPWRDVIEVLLPHLPWQMRQNRRVITIRRAQYFLDLMTLLRDESEEVLANHMEIYFVERHLKLDSEMYKLLKATSVEPHTLSRYIRERFEKRWQTCIQDLGMTETLERMLFDNWFTQREHIAIIRPIIGRVKDAIDKQMENSDWLDNQTRQKTMQKFKNLEEWIGFPTRAPVHGERNKTQILRPNAWLSKRKNLIYIQPALLISPIFSTDISALYNYAGLGATIGHELYHTLDECGSYLDGDVNIVWWETNMRIKCLNKKFLFIKEFNKITDREFKNRYDKILKSDTSMSFSENFPDVMGLEAAYNAYKELVSKDKSACETVEKFEKYSCDQMFYIAFANGYCGYQSKKKAMEKLETSVHSIDSVRVNGAVAQMESFGTAFNCSKESPMNPKEKLNMWRL